MLKLLRYWIPVVLWMVIIFSFSNRNRIQVAQDYTVNLLFFKSLHILEYAMLFVLTYRATRGTTKARRIDHVVMAFILTVIYAATDEIHQLFIPTREGRPRDVIIDAIGALIAWLILSKLLPRAPKKLQQLAKKLELVS